MGIIQWGICFQEYVDIMSTDMVALKIMKCVPGGRVAKEYDDIMSTDMVALKIMKCVPGGRVAKEWDGFFNICSVSPVSNTFKA
jgi:hypothetical protein